MATFFCLTKKNVLHLKFISKKSINIEPIIVHFLCTEWQGSLSQRYSRYNRKASCGYHDAQVYTVSGCTYGSLRIRIHAPEIVIFFQALVAKPIVKDD